MINGVFGPVTERLQPVVSSQVVVLVLHSVRRKQSLGLLVKAANMKKLQAMSEAHSCWHSSSDGRSKRAPTMLEIGSSEQRSPLWKRSHWVAAFNPVVQQLNRRRWLINMTWPSCQVTWPSVH